MSAISCVMYSALSLNFNCFWVNCALEKLSILLLLRFLLIVIIIIIVIVIIIIIIIMMCLSLCFVSIVCVCVHVPLYCVNAHSVVVASFHCPDYSDLKKKVKLESFPESFHA